MACEGGLSSKALTDLIKSDEHFDLIIAELSFNQDCFLGFAHKFSAPLIGVTTSVMMPWNNWKFGNPNNPSYIPSNFLPYSDQMTFLERVDNALMLMINDIMYHYFIEEPSNRIARKYFGYDLPYLRNIAYNASMILVDSHFAVSRPRPLVPAVVEIGGMHIGKAQLKKLPQVIINLKGYRC